MSDGTDITTVALVCPACGERIRAPRGDVLFACAQCSAVSEVEPRGLRGIECTWAAVGQPTDGPDLMLPYWCFHVDVGYSGEDADAVDHLARMVRPERVYVPAFRQRSVLVFGDMGLQMTYKPPGLARGEPGYFAGATLQSAEASRLVEPMVLWRADHVRDVTGVQVRAEVTGVEVVAVPARDEGKRLVDLLSGRQWPMAAFLDIDALRWKPG